MFAERGAQDKMQNIVHPRKPFSVAEQLHQQRCRRQDCHGWHEGSFRDEVVQSRKEKSKRSVHDFAAQVCVIAVLTETIMRRQRVR
jgi:hypothetical protein